MEEDYDGLEEYARALYPLTPRVSEDQCQREKRAAYIAGRRDEKRAREEGSEKTVLPRRCWN